MSKLVFMRNLDQIINRESSTHKGQNGKVAILGGSKHYSGAPSLVAKAAYRSGSDLVKIITSEEVSDVVRGFSENFIVRDYQGPYFSNESLEKALDLAKWSDVVVVGPGLAKPSGNALREFVNHAQSKLIIDAQAIDPLIDEELEALFTPHAKEAESIKNQYSSISNFVQTKGSVVLLKGEEDKIYTKDGVIRIKGGNPGMTVGGTGDVLTGIAAGLISQGANFKEAAKYSARINNKAADKISPELGYGFLPSDIINEIPRVICNKKS